MSVKNKKFFRKSQMEILGLAIVVVLILVATLFVVKFLLLKTPKGYRSGFIDANYASNMLNTFLKTAARDCSLLTMTELLQDCAQGRSIICGNGRDSCSYVDSTAKDIFGRTLSDWVGGYEFLAYTDIRSPFIKIGEPCKGEKRSKLFPIPISGATMYTKLDICGKSVASN